MSLLKTVTLPKLTLSLPAILLGIFVAISSRAQPKTDEPSAELLSGMQAPNLLPEADPLPPTLRQLIDWETASNAAVHKSGAAQKLKHFEIPLRLVQQNFAATSDPSMRAALIFKRNGEDFVRWPVHPEDTHFQFQVGQFLRSVGADDKLYEYFTGYFTASRSLFVVSPSGGFPFSLKISTNHAGGKFRRPKNLTVDEAGQVRMASDFVMASARMRTFERLVIQEEPVSLGLREVDQALLVRSLSEFSSPKRFYLPGFSALHSKTGRQIAELNGSSNVAVFWNENFNKPLAEAMAEFTATFGLAYESAHAQNFLIELDEALKPTGRIVFRDFGDTYASRNFFEARGMGDFVRRWDSGFVLEDRIRVTVGLLHGGEQPTWMNSQNYDSWGQDFFEAFEAKFARLSGVPLDQMRVGDEPSRSGKYFSYLYSDFDNPAWNVYYRAVAADAIRADTAGRVDNLAHVAEKAHVIDRTAPAARVAQKASVPSTDSPSKVSGSAAETNIPRPAVAAAETVVAQPAVSTPDPDLLATRSDSSASSPPRSSSLSSFPSTPGPTSSSLAHQAVKTSSHCKRALGAFLLGLSHDRF